MCGVIGYNGKFQKNKFEKSLDLLNHRGPDGRGTYYNSDHSIGLGHTRLSIIDISLNGSQPMKNEDGNLIISFNGEIYNFKEIRSYLEKDGYKFVSNTDTEVLLKLYHKKGYEMLHSIDGIFSFAILDNTKNEIFLARDSFGVKPLYVLYDEQGIAFSSEIGALLNLSSGQKTIDYKSMIKYCGFLWCPGTGTPLKNIKKVDPGSALVISNNKIKAEWQWYKHTSRRNLGLFKESKKEISEQLATKLKEAVHKQMISDVPLGTFLSGGIDSTAIAKFANEINPGIECFTIDTTNFYEKGVDDDLPYARLAAKKLNLKLNEIEITPSDVIENFENIIGKMDEPLADLAAMNVFFISKLAASKGIKVLLSGTGGDDIFTGYRRHTIIQYQDLLNHLPDFVIKNIQKFGDTFFKKTLFNRRAQKFLSNFKYHGNEQIINSFLWNEQDYLINLVHKDYKNELRNEIFSDMETFLNPTYNSFSSLQKMTFLDQRFFLTDHNLNYTDKMSMKAGVEVRVPFLDENLLVFASRIPMRYKQGFLSGKQILKKALQKHLPKQILNRPKTGFGLPIRRWIKRDLHPLVSEYLSKSSLKERGLFCPEKVETLINQNYKGLIDGSYSILAILTIEVWCRNNIDIKDL